MAIQDIIKKTEQAFGTPVLGDRLLADFRNLGIGPGEHFIVHSSLSAIGYVCGGAALVIKSLQECLTADGSLTMPAHSTSLTEPSYWENPPLPTSWWEHYRKEAAPFDPALTPTEWMGKIAEYFRQMPEVKRSYHPAHSFASWGDHAQMIIKDHALSNSFGAISPLGKLYELDAKILLLGVDHDSNTAIHLAESRLENLPDEAQGAPMIKDGKALWVEFQEKCYDNEDFLTLGKEFEKEHGLVKGKVGLADCKVMSMRSIVDFAESWLNDHRG